jgi:hypothetical protein
MNKKTMATKRGKKLSRRACIKQLTAAASAVISAPWILPANAFGSRIISRADDRITVGHIGIGGRGGSLLQSFLQLDDARCIAVCDPMRDRREERTAEINAFYAKMSDTSYNGCRAYNDFRELLEQPDIDAVVIATPDHWHVPIALAAAKAGKDMYVEKPLGVSVSENQKLCRAIKQHGTVFQYGTQQRSGRDFRFACELARNGYLGQLHTIHAWCADITSQAQLFNAPGGSGTPLQVPEGFDYDLWLGPAPFTPYTSDRCTSFGTYHHYDNSLGFIAGWGAHPLDIAQWGNKSDDTAPIEYEGTGEISKGFYESVYNWDMWCQYANSVKMRFMSTDAAKPIVTLYHPRFSDHGTTFIGTAGWVSVDRTGIFADPPSLLHVILSPGDIHLTESDNHQQNFLKCIRSRKAPISPITSALQSDIISHLCNISIRVRRSIKWDPHNQLIVGDDEASRLLQRPMRSPWHV